MRVACTDAPWQHLPKKVLHFVCELRESRAKNWVPASIRAFTPVFDGLWGTSGIEK
jgi:hypothetical protein